MCASPLLRSAQLADLPAIVAIYNANIPPALATADTAPITVKSRQKWFRDHTPDHYPLWVVTGEKGKIMGWLGFQRFYGRPAYAKTAELSIYIAPAHQRQGLGKLLLQQAIAASPDLGLKTLLGFIFAHNHPSIKLFRDQGFEQWGHLPGVAELHGQERDLLIFGLKVPPP